MVALPARQSSRGRRPRASVVAVCLWSAARFDVINRVALIRRNDWSTSTVRIFRTIRLKTSGIGCVAPRASRQQCRFSRPVLPHACGSAISMAGQRRIVETPKSPPLPLHSGSRRDVLPAGVSCGTANKAGPLFRRFAPANSLHPESTCCPITESATVASQSGTRPADLLGCSFGWLGTGFAGSVTALPFLSTNRATCRGANSKSQCYTISTARRRIYAHSGQSQSRTCCRRTNSSKTPSTPRVGKPGCPRRQRDQASMGG